MHCKQTYSWLCWLTALPIALMLLALQTARGVAEDGTALVGVRLALPLGGDPSAFARRVLDALTFAVPTTIEVPYQPGWEGAVQVLAIDGAERIGLRTGADPHHLAEQLRVTATQNLTAVLGPDVRGAGPDDTGPGVLNLLAAAAAAVERRSTDAVATALTTPDVDALMAAATGTSPARTRALLGAVAGSEVRTTVAELAAVGFLVDED